MMVIKWAREDIIYERYEQHKKERHKTENAAHDVPGLAFLGLRISRRIRVDHEKNTLGRNERAEA